MVAEVTMDDGFVDSSDDEDDMIDVGDLYQDEDEDEDEDEVEDSEVECNGKYVHTCSSCSRAQSIYFIEGRSLCYIGICYTMYQCLYGANSFKKMFH